MSNFNFINGSFHAIFQSGHQPLRSPLLRMDFCFLWLWELLAVEVTPLSTVSFLLCQNIWQKQLKGGRIDLGSQSEGIQPTMIGKARQQARGAAGHVVPTVRKQRDMNPGAQLTVFFVSVPDSSYGMMSPTLKGKSSHLH